MRYEIRPVAPAEWQRSRELRLTALQDPVASVAFARTYAEESAMTDDQWRQRASGVGAQQFVAVSGEDREWVGMVVAVIEGPDYVSLNSVYLRPPVRGSGVAEKLFAAAIAWTWDRADQVYLWVHEKNPRAQSFYRRLGFTPTGRTMASPLDAGLIEFEWVLARQRG
jgi:GNAT superfamily N-acetyltransferase